MKIGHDDGAADGDDLGLVVPLSLLASNVRAAALLRQSVAVQARRHRSKYADAVPRRKGAEKLSAGRKRRRRSACRHQENKDEAAATAAVVVGREGVFFLVVIVIRIGWNEEAPPPRVPAARWEEN